MDKIIKRTIPIVIPTKKILLPNVCVRSESIPIPGSGPISYRNCSKCKRIVVSYELLCNFCLIEHKNKQ